MWSCASSHRGLVEQTAWKTVGKYVFFCVETKYIPPQANLKKFWGNEVFIQFFFEVKMFVYFCEGTNCLTMTVACETNSLSYCHLKIFKRIKKIVNARN